MTTVTLPIYYTTEYKTKPSKTSLLSDNWVRNLHPHLKNTVKQHYHRLVFDQLGICQTEPLLTFNLTMHLYYKTTNCDPSNVFHQIEKYVLDALSDLNYISNDTVLNHITTTSYVLGQDKLNPRCVVTLLPSSK